MAERLLLLSASNYDYTRRPFLFSCVRVMTGNNNSSGKQIDSKSNQWFGASVYSSGNDGVVVVSYLFVYFYFIYTANDFILRILRFELGRYFLSRTTLSHF